MSLFDDMAFVKNIEDFACGHCKLNVSGSGYTNHCPKCLWSKHVDIEPGDRAEPCGGMMEPISLEGTTPKYRIVHTCQKCGAIRRVKIANADDADAIVTLSGREALRAAK